MIRKILLTGAAAVAMSAAWMPSANAGVTNCVFEYVNHGVEAWYFDCNLNTVGFCTAYWDPLYQFPNYVVSEGIEYPLCLAL